MKKRTVIALIVAILLVLCGGTMLVLGLSFAGDSKPESLLTEQEVTIGETFNGVLVETGDCDVNVVLCKGTLETKVVIREREETEHMVSLDEGTLKITMTDNRTWQDFVGVNWESMEMTLYLPEREYASVQITTSTGDIRIPEGLSGREMQLHSDTGDILCGGTVEDLLHIETDTGDIQINGCSPLIMELESDTGDMELEGLFGNGEFHVTNNTGSVEMTNVNSRILTVETTTGEIELERVVAEEYLQTFSDTGSIRLEYCDSARVNIETTTGDISGHFMTPKSFDAYSNTGNVRVANTPGGGGCRVESDTGDIYFE